jgi:hypothetical protein
LKREKTPNKEKRNPIGGLIRQSLVVISVKGKEVAKGSSLGASGDPVPYLE